MKYGRFPPHVVLFLIYPVRMCSIWVLIVLHSVYLLKLSAERFLVPNLIINLKQDKTEQKFTTSFSMVIILFPLLTPVEFLVFSKLTSPLENIQSYIDILYIISKKSLSLSSPSLSLWRAKHKVPPTSWDFMKVKRNNAMFGTIKLVCVV